MDNVRLSLPVFFAFFFHSIASPFSRVFFSLSLLRLSLHFTVLFSPVFFSLTLSLFSLSPSKGYLAPLRFSLCRLSPPFLLCHFPILSLYSFSLSLCLCLCVSHSFFLSAFSVALSFSFSASFSFLSKVVMNLGAVGYAFNDIQRLFLPSELRPPPSLCRGGQQT